ncbi:MAG: hypothetical protein J5898_07725 [Lachnospiraceae bacterium]|nr:hypothetical protein [Lachnospiraceae bacterium]
MDNRIYVAVDVRFLTDGSVVPREIIWSNGRTYGIDSVIETRRIRTADSSVRFTCRIRGGAHYLYLDRNNRWFVEPRRTVSRAK